MIRLASFLLLLFQSVCHLMPSLSTYLYVTLLLLSHFSHVRPGATPQTSGSPTTDTRIPRPWDSPGKNTGVVCHFLLQCMKVKSESEVALSQPTLSDPMDHSLPGSSIHGIFQARVLEWGATAFSTFISQETPNRENRLYIFNQSVATINNLSIQKSII